MKTLNYIFATIIGFIVGGFIIVPLFEYVLSPNLFVFPEGYNPTDMQWIANNMDKIPVGSKIMVVLGHFFGIITAMFVSAKISKTSIIPAYISGGLLLLATAFNIIMLPKELWFSLSDGIFAIIAFFIGRSLASSSLYSNNVL